MSLFAAPERRAEVLGVRVRKTEGRALRRAARKRRVAVAVLIRQILGAWIARQERYAARASVNKRNAKGVRQS